MRKTEYREFIRFKLLTNPQLQRPTTMGGKKKKKGKGRKRKEEPEPEDEYFTMRGEQLEITI